MMATMYSPLVYAQAPSGGGYKLPPIPSTFIAPAFTPPTWNPYSSTAADRTQYWSDSAGTLTWDQVLTTALGAQGAASYQAAEAINAGLAVTSTSNSALNGTYSLSDSFAGKLNRLLSYYTQEGTFPNGSATVTIADASGATHSFSATEFKALYKALGDYLTACEETAIGANATVPDPSKFGAIA